MISESVGSGPLAVARARLGGRRTRLSTRIAAASWLVVAAGLVVVGTTAPAWPQVAATFFSPAAAWAALPAVLSGFWLDVQVLVVAALAALVLGSVLAVLRSLPGPELAPVRGLAGAVVAVVGRVPPLVAVGLVGFGIPALRLRGSPADPVVLGTIALAAVHAARVAAALRTGAAAVPESLRTAARSLALPRVQAAALVIAPQAGWRALPRLLDDLVTLQRDVGLVAVLGALEAVRAAQLAQGPALGATPWVLAALLFVALAAATGRLVEIAAARVGGGGRG